MTVNAMLECVTELTTAAQRLPFATSKTDESTARVLLRTAVRQMSVPIRKLCLDGNMSLLQRVILEPMFLPTGGTKAKYSRAELKWRTPHEEWVLGFEGGRKEEVVVPESEHEISIGRLYGVEFQEGGWCVIKSPFNETGIPIKFDAWLTTKILQVNSIGYSIRDTLKLVADFEGAHTSDHLPAFVAVGVRPEDMGKGTSKRYRMANCVYFGCLSYIHLVVVYSGLYIIRMMQELVQRHPLCKEGVDISGVANIIAAARTNLVARSQIVNCCHEMIVVGKSNLPGAEQRKSIYRIWSGCEEWDKPVGATNL